MGDRGKIIAGMVIFLGLVTFPFWYGQGRTPSPPQLPIDTPEIRKLAVKRCIEPTAYMKASHMELIDSWRNAVVREGRRVYLASDGRKVPMSLSQTCLGCHSNKEKFCDACHNYAGVNPACFTCHVIPQEVKP